MDQSLFARNILFFGEEHFRRIQRSFVAVIGLGGVGGCAAEALARCGVGKLLVVDCDIVKPSDVNRQLIALSTNVNQSKADAARERLLSINPSLVLDARKAFFHLDTAAELITPDLDFVVDAIDSLTPKSILIRHCMENGLPIVSAMGAAGRKDPFQIRISTLEKTSVCPLARMLRKDIKKKLRPRRVSLDIPVVYSLEPPIPGVELDQEEEGPEQEGSEGTYLRGRKRKPLPTLPTLPAIFGLVLANYVIEKLVSSPSKKVENSPL